MILEARPIGGSIAAIPSKSQAHRLLICAALSDGPSAISCPSLSHDIEATAACLRMFGAGCTYDNDTYHVAPIRSPGGPVHCGCGESGATLRFLLPVAAALGLDVTFQLRGRLPERPLSPLWEALEAHGCTLSRPTADTLRCTGRLKNGCCHMAGNVSSQFISGLLLALPLTGGASELILTSPLESASYVALTLDALRTWGIQVECTAAGWRLPAGQRYRRPDTPLRVEGDWSNAAFWLCTGAVSRPVTVTGLNSASVQGDRAILNILQRFGAKVRWYGDAVTVSPAPLRAVELDASDIPDLVPPLALVAACAAGTTRIFGAARLRLKESDRLQSIANILNALGGRAEIRSDRLLVHGTGLTGGHVDACNDHRIAMLAGIASAVCTQPIQLHGAASVSKSYPTFWDDLQTLQKEGSL